MAIRYVDSRTGNEPSPGRQIQVARLNQGLSRRRLASQLGMHESVLRRVEGGERLGPAHAKTIADWLGVTVVDLFPLPDEQAA